MTELHNSLILWVVKIVTIICICTFKRETRFQKSFPDRTANLSCYWRVTIPELLTEEKYWYQRQEKSSLRDESKFLLESSRYDIWLSVKNRAKWVPSLSEHVVVHTAKRKYIHLECLATNSILLENNTGCWKLLHSSPIKQQWTKKNSKAETPKRGGR